MAEEQNLLADHFNFVPLCYVTQDANVVFGVSESLTLTAAFSNDWNMRNELRKMTST